MKHAIVLGIICLMIGATPLQAAEPKAGTIGFGWYSMSAPVGGRIWVSPMVGVDLGFGFADKNVLGATTDRFHFNLGFPVNVVKTEKVNFFIRPGVELKTNARTVGTEVKSKQPIWVWNGSLQTNSL